MYVCTIHKKQIYVPIGIQNFENLRRNGYVYVDKTHFVYRLAATGKYYFLSRPRRFGKSLLLSTMEAYFQGKKELFSGLAIDTLEKDWVEYPVLRLDFSGENFSGNFLIRQMSVDLRSGRPKDFMKRMEAFFAKQNYQIQADVEKDFQYAMSIILQLLGEYFTVRTEDPDSSGRTDITIEAPEYIYIIEIKKDDSAQAALDQIEAKAYARRYGDDSRKVFRIGVSFSTETRAIEEWKVEE